jgi:TM2 domain-containing membrane protein YozV
MGVLGMSNLLAKKDLSAEQLSLVQSEFGKKNKSKGIMYLLWWFTGGIGGHRYYLGDIGYAVGMTFTLGGIGVWTLIDAFLIGKRLEQKNEQLENDIIHDVIGYTKKVE